MKYKVQWRYTSSLGGPWEAGEAVELDEELAAAINLDSPGVLALEIPGQERATKRAPMDRMVRGGKDRAVQENFGVMDRETFKAVRDKEEKDEPG